MKCTLLLVVAAILLSASPNVAQAVAKKRTPPPPLAMKRGITVDPIQNRYIELPDPAEPVAYYGANIYEALITDLQKTRDYAVLVGDGPTQPGVALSAARALAEQAPVVDPDPCLINTPPESSSQINISLNERPSFTTGSRGERLAYGFTRENQNPYNAGIDEKLRNEFPLRPATADPTWFDNTFADTGGLHTGLELGHEINFDVLIVGAKLQHVEYQASLGLDVSFNNRFGESVHKQVTTTGKGFYFNLSANFVYAGIDYMAAVMFARKTALLDAFNRTIRAAITTIGNEIALLPLTARLAATCAGSYYVSVGGDFRVPVGQRFYDRTQWSAGKTPTVFTVQEVFQRSARVAIAGTGFGINDLLVSLAPNEVPPVIKPMVMAASALSADGGGANTIQQNVDAGNVNFDVPNALQQFVEGFFTRLWEGLKALVTLPYRIWRYFEYDQNYGGGELSAVTASQAYQLSTASWALKAIGMPAVFKACVGKDANCLGARNMIVAVIDSGIDYNHRELRRNIFWDGVHDTAGFDFMSDDSRAYDDHAHGTGIASVISGGGSRLIGVAPNVTLMPLKAFSPYGFTNSSAIYSSFVYAVANGAKIIVIGWGTSRYSKALEDGIRLAEANGVLVIAAAGDAGQDLTRQPYYPAAFSAEVKNLVVVAGQGIDSGLTRAPGMNSNYGKIVDLAAPGDAVEVASPRNNYQNSSNTGVAAGLVAGAAALIWSKCPKIDASHVKLALLEGAIPVEALRGEVNDNKALSVPGALSALDTICK